QTSLSLLLVWLLLSPATSTVPVATLERHQSSISVLLFPRVVAEIELTEITVQVLLSDVMVHPIDPAFQCRKVALDSVRRDADSVLVSHVFIGSMVHLIVF